MKTQWSIYFEEFTSSGFLSHNQISIFNSVGLTFLFINSAVKSYIYVSSSSFYRQGFLEAFWLSQRKNIVSSQHMSRKSMALANRTNGTQYAYVSAKSWVWFIMEHSSKYDTKCMNWVTQYIKMIAISFKEFCLNRNHHYYLQHHHHYGLFYNQGTSSVSFLVKNEMFCNSTTCFLLYYE